ncbi:response regulator [Aquimarina sediminis]|uniref:response regulator n=1 Tax=Aquimarina sediminis TaxID=2070536 RepID=UPI0013E8D2FD|nr:response regulator [Aquimarina sediminis]
MKLKLSLHIACFSLYFLMTHLYAQVSDNRVNRDSIEKILEESIASFSKLTEEGTEKGIYLLELAENLAERLNDPYTTVLVNRERISFLFNNDDTITIKKYLSRNLDIIKKIGDKRQLGLYYEDVGVYNSALGKRKEAHLAALIAEQLLSKYGEVEDVIDVNYNLCLGYLKKKKWEASLKHGIKSLNAIEKTGIKQNRSNNLYLYLAEDYINLNQFEKAEECFANIKNGDSLYANDPHFKGRLLFAEGNFYEKTSNYKKAAFFYSQSSNSFYEYHNKRTKEVSTSLVLSNELSLQKEENERIKIENELKAEQLRNSRFIILFGTLVILGLVLMSILQYRVSFYKTKMNKLLKKNYKKLIKANKKVDKALKAKSEFLDSVTHELLTPLNTIKGTTFLMKKEELSVHQMDQMQLINLSTDTLLNLIKDTIHLNDLEKGAIELKKEQFNLKSLLNNLIDSSLMVKDNNNKIYRKIDNTIPDLLISDMLKVSKIFLKILENALKFTKNGSIYIEVSLVTLTDNNASVEFSVKDTGVGMTKDQVNKAFEAFYQGSVKINREYGGTGLGLSIVKRMLDLLDSDIVLKSKPNEGTSVSFVINFGVPEPVTEKNAYQSNDSNSLKKNVNILLVEDNKVNQLITKKIISNYGFCCDSAYDGTEAVAMVKKQNYSIILMDIMMPKMDGFEATENIRGFNTEVPIVALTALSEKLNKERFNEVGIFKILQKPVIPEQLYEVLADCCKE